MSEDSFDEMEEMFDEDSTGDEFNEYDEFSHEDIEQEKQAVDLGREEYSRIVVDLYKTKLHGAMVGIRQRDQYMAKSRQFTKNTYVRGEVTYYYGWDKEQEKDDYKEVVTINEFFWRTDEKSFLYKKAAEEFKDYNPKEYAKLMRRAIIKTFVGLDKKQGDNQGRWLGTIEESQVMSLALTFGEKDPLPFFYVILPGYKYRLPLFRTHAVTGERFVFVLIDEEKHTVRPFYIEGKRLTPGSDYTVFDPCTMQKVAFIDDRANNIGGKVDIKFYPENEELNRNRVFRRILILFAALSKYLHEIYKNYKKLYQAMVKQKDYIKDLRKAQEKGEDISKVNEKYRKAMEKVELIKTYVVSGHELSLHYNPRRVRS